MKDELASIQHRGMMGEKGGALPASRDRAAGLRPQPPAASSQSRIPSAVAYAIERVLDVWTLPPAAPPEGRKWHCQHEEWLAASHSILRAAQATAAWQPIETAPKGEMVLVGGLNWTNDWWMNFGRIDRDGSAYGDWHYDLEPTHWHTLPDPPAQGIEAGTGETREAGLDAKHDSPVGQQADAPNSSRNPSQGEDHHARD